VHRHEGIAYLTSKAFGDLLIGAVG